MNKWHTTSGRRFLESGGYSRQPSWFGAKPAGLKSEIQIRDELAAAAVFSNPTNRPTTPMRRAKVYQEPCGCTVYWDGDVSCSAVACGSYPGHAIATIAKCSASACEVWICDSNYQKHSEIYLDAAWYANPPPRMTGLGARLPVTKPAANTGIIKAYRTGVPGEDPDVPVTAIAPKASSHFPHICPKCGDAAYIGFSKIECSRGGCKP